MVSFHTADSKPDKQEVNGTMILPPLAFLGESLKVVKGRVFNSKLGRFALLHRKCILCAQPLLDLDT
jgi:hypothetical protein